MPKSAACTVRLTKSDRCALRNYAEALVVCSEEEQAELKAHQAVLDLIRAIAAEAATSEEVAVLEKFKAMEDVSHFEFDYETRRQWGPTPKLPRFSFTFGEGLRHGTFMDSDDRVFVRVPTSMVNGSFLRVPKEHHPLLISLINTWSQTHAAHVQARNRVLAPIFSVIDSRRTLRQVGDVWPPALDLAAEFNKANVPSFSDDKVRIEAVTAGHIREDVRKSEKVRKDVKRAC